MQFDTTINRWHTSKNTARINASNPCSEYMFLDDSACNLASLNLMKFVGPGRRSSTWKRFGMRCDTVIIAQEIIVDNASYPTEKIAKNSHDFRPLGLGYANLGALLMSMGIPYDSDHGPRLCGGDHRHHVRPGVPDQRAHRRSHGSVRRLRHERRAVPRRDPHASRRGQRGSISKRVPSDLYAKRAVDCWDDAYELGKHAGFRNAQMTVLAPTGTIGFMMDCDTTGIEPDLALVKYKKLVGGGVIKIVNNTVPAALIKLGYTPEQVERDRRPHRFDRDDRRRAGAEARAPAGVRLQLPPAERHAVDPLHGPRAHDGRGAAVYFRRDFEDHQHAGRVHGGRRHGRLHRELEAGAEGGGDLSRQFEARAAAELGHGEGREGGNGQRRRAVEVRRWSRRSCTGRCGASCRTSGSRSRTSFRSAATKATSRWACTTTARRARSSSRMAKEGSTISGLMDSFATAISYALQYGVPLKFFVDKFSHVRFEPSGWTGNPAGPVREVDHGLHFPLAGREVPGPGVRRRTRRASRRRCGPRSLSPQQNAAVPGGGDAMLRCARNAAG